MTPATRLIRVAAVACALVLGAMLVRGVNRGLEEAVYGAVPAEPAAVPGR